MGREEFIYQRPIKTKVEQNTEGQKPKFHDRCTSWRRFKPRNWIELSIVKKLNSFCDVQHEIKQLQE